MFLNWGQVAPLLPGDMWQYLETFWGSQVKWVDRGRGGVGRGQGCYKHSTRHRAAPCNKGSPGPKWLSCQIWETLFKWKLFVCVFKYLKLVCWTSTNYDLIKIPLFSVHFSFKLHLMWIISPRPLMKIVARCLTFLFFTLTSYGHFNGQTNTGRI